MTPNSDRQEMAIRVEPCDLCSFSGKFTNLRKINEYTYEMDMEDLTYENTPGEEEIAVI